MPSLNIGNERCYFMMYWEGEKYEESVRYVFCDELEGYTIWPYKSSLKDVPQYCENRSEFEMFYIFLVDYKAIRIKKIPCNIRESLKQVYISEDFFNKYWKSISENICKGVSENHYYRRKTPDLVNQMVDLSLVEDLDRKVRIGKSFKIEYTSKEINIEKQRLVSKRANALEDNKIRFVYSKTNKYVHDKSCEQAQKINYWNFEASEELPPDKELCAYCRRQIYIRNAIKSDTKRFAWYYRFFEGKVGNRALERFLYEGNTKLHMEMLDELQVEHKEDTWIIKMDTQGICTLYHNNYVIVNENMRYITDGFHIQKHVPSYLTGIIEYIEEYDWQKHLQMRLKEAENQAHQIAQIDETPPKQKKKLLERFIQLIQKIFGIR